MGEQQKRVSPVPDPSPPAGESAAWRKYPNPPESVNPDVETLRDQWRYATRRFGRLYSHAWGTAILAGAALFGLGWFIKGSNPIPSRAPDRPPPNPDNTNQ